MTYKFIIYAPSFDENIGGVIALHRLCHLLNECGATAYLHPFIPSFELAFHNIQEIGAYIKSIQYASSLDNFRVHSDFRTPVLKPSDGFVAPDDCIVVYPEVVFGNPLRAKNVVRWLLHKPGFHTGKIFYGQDEIFYRYADFGDDSYSLHGSVNSDLILRIQYIPVALYLSAASAPPEERKNVAYCVRKGRGRAAAHDLENSILIDGKSHVEIAAILAKTHTFISYDLYTHYSYFAAIAGCNSIVIPETGLSETEWKPQVEDRFGLAYGYDRIDFARATRDRAIERQVRLDSLSLDNTKAFLRDVETRLAKRSQQQPTQGL